MVQNNTDVSSYSSGGQKSGFHEAKIKILEALGVNTTSLLFLAWEAAYISPFSFLQSQHLLLFILFFKYIFY